MAVLQKLAEQKRAPKGRILFLIGPGNNGADGWVLVRLIKDTFSRHCEIYCPQLGKTDLWLKQKEKAGNPILLRRDQISKSGQWDFIFDCVYGTGLSRPVGEDWSEIFRELRAHSAYKVAVDLPSGLPADTGVPLGAAFKADLTVTFGALKPGLLQMQGPALAGQIKLARLLFPEALIRDIANTHFAFGQHAAIRARPRLKSTDHKGSRGHCVLLCGSEAYRGAGILVAEAALRTGAGYVELGAGEKVYPDLLKLPEVLYFERDELFQRRLDFQKTAFVLGPGLLDPDFLRRALLFLLEKKAPRVVLDAEAINVLSGLEMSAPLPESWILTPHPGELARLLRVSAEDINADRCRWGREAQKRWGGVVLLKGYRTLVCSASRSTLVLAGNSALAKAGSGDVLSGILGGLYAQIPQAERVALLGAYAHGQIADDSVRHGGYPASLLPSDLVHRIGPALAGLRASASR